MKAVVFAYHTVGAVGIRALLRHGFRVSRVYTHQDDPEENIWFESVAGLCEKEGIPYDTPTEVNAPEVVAGIKGLCPDVMFSFYYRLMLGPELLKVPKQGAFNLHGSLLPHYRGRCPVNWVIIKGERKTGVTLHYMVEKPDAGDIVGQAEVWIAKEDTARTLLEKLARAAEGLLDELLPLIKAGQTPRTPMDLSRGSYFGGRKPEDGKIDWSRSAWEVYNLVRAVTRPYPGAFTSFMGERMMVWWAVPDDSAQGLLLSGETEIEAGKVFVGTKFGSIRLEEVEWKGNILKGPEIAEALEPHWQEKFE